jgi:hydrogenase maturation protease
VGSTLRGDDAAGLLAAQELSRLLDKTLKRSTKQPYVEIFLGETAPENLTSPIKEFQPTHLVILDALDAGAKPGHIAILGPDDLGTSATASTHNVSLKLLMDYLRHFLECEIIVLGIQLIVAAMKLRQ